MKEVFIVSAVRTPMGSFGGAFAKVHVADLGATAIKGALEKAGVPAEHVQEVLMGNVVSANVGQAPARQAAMKAGLSDTVPATTVNKVCASGMKSTMFGAQAIMTGMSDLVVTGGMENMSLAPFYLTKSRWGMKFGHGEVLDALMRDGLTDIYNDVAMGVCADNTAKEYNISREQQDEFAITSYKRSAAATESGAFKEEIVPVPVPQRKGDPVMVSEDEEFKRVKFEKVPGLRPAFTKEGTVTAANASTLNDGASAMVLASKEKVEELGLKPIAKIVSFADAAHDPMFFTTAPTKAAPIALERAGISKEDVSFYEVNEAFAVVTLAFNQEMGISNEIVNVNGGGVSLGHPIGCSGARIVTTLAHVLQNRDGQYGCAAICNGGGGASAMVIERV